MGNGAKAVQLAFFREVVYVCKFDPQPKSLLKNGGGSESFLEHMNVKEERSRTR